METFATIETPRLNKARRVGGEVAHVPEPHGVREFAIAFAFVSPILGVTLCLRRRIHREPQARQRGAHRHHCAGLS